MTEEEIMKEITEPDFPSRVLFKGNVHYPRVISPAKLAAFLAKHLPALHAPEVTKEV